MVRTGRPQEMFCRAPGIGSLVERRTTLPSPPSSELPPSLNHHLLDSLGRVEFLCAGGCIDVFHPIAAENSFEEAHEKWDARCWDDRGLAAARCKRCKASIIPPSCLPFLACCCALPFLARDCLSSFVTDLILLFPIGHVIVCSELRKKGSTSLFDLDAVILASSAIDPSP